MQICFFDKKKNRKLVNKQSRLHFYGNVNTILKIYRAHFIHNLFTQNACRNI